MVLGIIVGYACHALWADPETAKTIALYISLVFFFSSRRRHTRCLSDWSSDVCSSDLNAHEPGCRYSPRPASLPQDQVNRKASECVRPGYAQVIKQMGVGCAGVLKHVRSEERRVGKECRSRRTQEQ